jgi:hypothetical protein
MPSVTHEAPIELIRQNPALAVELLRAVTDLPLPVETDISLGPTDLTDVVPAKYLADAVVVVSDAASGVPVLVIIIEPQGRDDPTKEFSWPVYITAVRRAVQCRRAFLLVICPDPDEAEKCRRIIRTGHPGFDLAPEVIDPLNAPGADGASPYLAIFAACIGAIDMETEQGARQVLTAIQATGASNADRERLTTIILTIASGAAQQILEDMMTTIEWKSDFIEGFHRQGREEGLEQGKAEYLLKIIDARRIAVTDQERQQVTSCTDITQLDLWFERALVATTAADIFKD